jgi:two-component system osmolarity sensor histidine kinase EnvZ
VPPLPVRPQALRRAVANLIDNTQRHGGAGQAVELSLRYEAEWAIVEVSDRGPGIPAEAAERLKRPFTRLEAARSNTGGAGLGLGIVERVANQHGGSLELLPRAGGGLTARVRMRRP